MDCFVAEEWTGPWLVEGTADGRVPIGATVLPAGGLAFWGDPPPGEELLVRFACSSGPLGPGLDCGLALLLVRDGC